MKTFKQFISHKSPKEKKKPLDYAAIRAASAQSTPTQKTGSTKFVMHREGYGPWGKISQDTLDKIAKAKKREEKEKGLTRRPGSTPSKDTINYVTKVNKLSEEK
jgi:hypothetical protein